MNDTTRNWRTIESPAAVADALVGLYERRGAAHYDEVLSQTEHALQSGQLAVADGAAADLVVAAFLHDVGHLLMSEPQGFPTEDRHHEDVGSRFLANWFPAEVTAPVRLHVAAKRYLCAVDPSYTAGLSDGSIRSLAAQGGPMTATEVAEFEATPGYEPAVDVRRWDDRAKVPGAATSDLSSFREMIVAVLSSGS